MNSGVQDAGNLAEKLGQVWRGEAAQSLLDRYDRPQNRAEMKAIGDDPRRAYDDLLGTSMIASIRRAAAIE